MIMTQPTQKQFEKALKETIFSTPKEKVKYENKKPTKQQNQKWKLEQRR